MNDPISHYSRLQLEHLQIDQWGTSEEAVFASYSALHIDTAAVPLYVRVPHGKYLLDVALDVEWQVEEELETLQDVECIACGVSLVFAP